VNGMYVSMYRIITLGSPPSLLVVMLESATLHSMRMLSLREDLLVTGLPPIGLKSAVVS
jgi:hypothetical protein